LDKIKGIIRQTLQSVDRKVSDLAKDQTSHMKLIIIRFVNFMFTVSRSYFCRITTIRYVQPMPITYESVALLKFTATDGFLAFLTEHKIKTTPKGRSRWKPGDTLQAAADAHLHGYAMHLAGQHIMNCEAFSYSMSPLSFRVRIGRYCSIGPNVRLMGPRHAIEAVTSSELLYRGRRGMFVDSFAAFGTENWKFPDNPGPGSTEIGHDVWIGQDVLLKQGIKIGTGAVIGAAAVVLKDVAPYEIVAGVPAKRLRFRFDKDTIYGLLQSQWWQYAIPQHPELPWTDPAAFLPAFETLRRENAITPFMSDLGSLRDIILNTD
jgi:virginiamycin A acetyltransferase